MVTDDPWMSEDEATEYVGCSAGVLRSVVNSGRLGGTVSVFTGEYRYARREIERLKQLILRELKG